METSDLFSQRPPRSGTFSSAWHRVEIGLRSPLPVSFRSFRRVPTRGRARVTACARGGLPQGGSTAHSEGSGEPKRRPLPPLAPERKPQGSARGTRSARDPRAPTTDPGLWRDSPRSRRTAAAFARLSPRGPYEARDRRRLLRDRGHLGRRRRRAGQAHPARRQPHERPSPARTQARLVDLLAELPDLHRNPLRLRRAGGAGRRARVDPLGEEEPPPLPAEPETRPGEFSEGPNVRARAGKPMRQGETAASTARDLEDGGPRVASSAADAGLGEGPRGRRGGPRARARGHASCFAPRSGQTA